MSEVSTIPVLPLRDAVIFPGVTSPVVVGRPLSLRAVETVLRSSEKLIFCVAQRANTDVVKTEGLYTFGTLARIEKIQRGPSGVQLMVHSLKRGVVLRVSEQDGYLVAAVREAEEMMPVDPEDATFEALEREVRGRAAELGQKSGLPKEAVEQVLGGLDHPGRLADLVAGYRTATSPPRYVLDVLRMR